MNVNTEDGLTDPIQLNWVNLTPVFY